MDALTIMAERVKNLMLQSMLNRYANSIESGVPDEDFLSRELITIRSIYRNTYEQGLEMLKKWGDAYIAMLFSEPSWNHHHDLCCHFLAGKHPGNTGKSSISSSSASPCSVWLPCIGPFRRSESPRSPAGSKEQG
ncbi:MAG: hypothetical protein IPI71_10120 [Methanolinea sp.]|nr:MAG: hypothetical protein IPI71_10120 [Methanolinea sp.]